MQNLFADDDINRMRVVLGRISRRVDRHSSEGGVTRTQFSMLSTTARLGPLGVRELAEIEGLNPTMLSRMIGKLEDAGLVARSTDPNDKRVVNVHVTQAGSDLYQRLRRERTALFAEWLSQLPANHAAELLQALPALEALAEQMCQPSVPGVAHRQES